MPHRTHALSALLLFALFIGSAAHSAPPVGAQTRVGEIEGLAFEVKVQGPAAQATPLQVACVFEYVEGDLITPPALPAPLNGMRHLDEALHGLVTELRKSGRFAGHALETLLITPPQGSIPAQHLLLIGLGERTKLTPELMRRVGSVGMREALRLGVSAYSHASDLKDAGVDSPTRAVADAVLTGALEAYRTQVWLATKGAAPAPAVHTLTLLSGPSFYEDTVAAGLAFLSHVARP